MSTKKIIQHPAEVLSKTAELVKDFDNDELKSLIHDMEKALKRAQGAGIAAPQIGVSKSVFVIPNEYAPKVRMWHNPFTWFRPTHQIIFINPRIVCYSNKKEEEDEGCLSVSGKFHPLTRSLEVTLRAQNEKGRKFKVKATDMLARIFQHETDHLNGILFLDRLHEK